MFWMESHSIAIVVVHDGFIRLSSFIGIIIAETALIHVQYTNSMCTTKATAYDTMHPHTLHMQHTHTPIPNGLSHTFLALYTDFHSLIWGGYIYLYVGMCHVMKQCGVSMFSSLPCAPCKNHFVGHVASIVYGAIRIHFWCFIVPLLFLYMNKNWTLRIFYQFCPSFAWPRDRIVSEVLVLCLSFSLPLWEHEDNDEMHFNTLTGNLLSWCAKIAIFKNAIQLWEEDRWRDGRLKSGVVIVGKVHISICFFLVKEHFKSVETCLF